MIIHRTAKQLRQDVALGLFASVFLLGPGLAALGQNTATIDPANGKLASVIRLGEAIVKDTTTHSLSKDYVGNALSCTSCHLDNGRHQRAGTFLGTATAYPAWSPREERVITLEDRVLNCFMRSCNGTRPPLGSEVSVAVTAYITSLSQDMPVKMNSKRPIGPGAVKQLSIKADQADINRGASLYAARCAECHQQDGQGDKENPPVWGDRSYNDGAGLSSVDNLAAWLKVAMPLDEADLSDEQAFDIAVYVNSQKRPHFDLSQHLPVKERLGEYNASTAK
jgi:thiosulfate dehydrogenase